MSYGQATYQLLHRKGGLVIPLVDCASAALQSTIVQVHSSAADQSATLVTAQLPPTDWAKPEAGYITKRFVMCSLRLDKVSELAILLYSLGKLQSCPEAL